VKHPSLALADVNWRSAKRIIRSVYPPIDLFEDIADPEDWPLLIAAEQKTNPRLMESLGALDQVPPGRRVSGPGASFLMSPFTHASIDRPSRFSDGRYGVLYVARHFETALFETIHHHQRFMAATAQKPGWTSQFRELVMGVKAKLHVLNEKKSAHAAYLDRDDYAAAQADGIAYPSQRHSGGECVALLYPDLARKPRQGRHLDYHWDGARVDLVRDVGERKVFRVG
jgi:hypothetical protein